MTDFRRPHQRVINTWLRHPRQSTHSCHTTGGRGMMRASPTIAAMTWMARILPAALPVKITVQSY